MSIPTLDFDPASRRSLWQQVSIAVEDYLNRVASGPVSRGLDPAAMRALLAPFDFNSPIASSDAIEFITRQLAAHQVHTPHPRYFGLFNPASTPMGIAADTIAAAFNPQLASWTHSPLAIEIEQHLIRSFAERFGYPADTVDGTFASGGAEANHTAVLAALVSRFPACAAEGVRALSGQPVLYVSSESHDSVLKAARLCGLGTNAVRSIPVDADLRMNCDTLAEQIQYDRKIGFAPFLVVATAGTTSTGIVDPIGECADIAGRENLWLHVDAAWGGAAALVPELRYVLDGIERSDSVTFDAHKWLSVPMGAGIFITRHPSILNRTFGIHTGYMPREADAFDVVHPFAHSMQWSRRFTGLKVFLSLAVAGWDGYANVLRHQTEMGRLLKAQLEESGWASVTNTPLPVVCFIDRRHPQGDTREYLDEVAKRIVESGAAWISTARVSNDRTFLRACITNYKTGPDDIAALVHLLNTTRDRMQTGESA